MTKNAMPNYADLKTFMFEWPGMTPEIFDAVLPAIKDYFDSRADLAPPSDKDRAEAHNMVFSFIDRLTESGKLNLVLYNAAKKLCFSPSDHAAELEKVRTLIEKAGIDMTDGDKAEALSILTAIIEKKGA